MKKAIVTTTINPPTEALKKFIEIGERDNWIVVIAGDKTTPHEDFEDLASRYEHVFYLSPDQQEGRAARLSRLIGWRCIQRRNFAMLFALEAGAEVIATVDDDNIPYSGWGQNCMVGQEIDMVLYKSAQPAFDPLSPLMPTLWHRGFPIQMLDGRSITQTKGFVKRRVLVQADLWDGDPDIDAIARIAHKPEVKFKPTLLTYGSDKIAPFNSQNTFLSREVFPTYFLFPGVGRMDDIWAAYATQFAFPDSVVFARASVLQKRNDHDLIKDLEAELLGYRHNNEFVQSPDDWQQFLPDSAMLAYEEWKALINTVVGEPNGKST